MRKVILLIISLIFITGCSTTYLKFIKNEHDFGTITQMKKYSYEFSFSNISKKAVYIENVKGG